jgi:hypothetical protein
LTLGHPVGYSRDVRRSMHYERVALIEGGQIR